MQKEGRLGKEVPEKEQAYEYVYDPENPVPTYGGVNSHYFPEENGPRDQSRFLEREDVLTFETDTIADTLYILGKINMVLFASSDAPDTDFTAKLMVKRSDGQYRIIEDGIIRAANRNTQLSKEWLEKDEVYRMEIDLGYAGIEIKPGEQIVLQISSSNFPKYNIHHNVKMHSLETSSTQKANQTVFAGGRNASFLSITTVSKEFIEAHRRSN